MRYPVRAFRPLTAKGEKSFALISDLKTLSVFNTFIGAGNMPAKFDVISEGGDIATFELTYTGKFGNIISYWEFSNEIDKKFKTLVFNS